MAVDFVADAEVVNGTAGTSVVVSAPAGSDSEFLVAFIAATATPTISTPAGWTLIGTEDSATNVRMAAFYRVGTGGATSWTWTLGSSQRNLGWVGAYSGVDSVSPIFDAEGTADTTAGTSFSTAGVSVRRLEGRLVTAVAAVRTASGAATTWTNFDIERADMSTNAGAGTDIAGSVADELNANALNGNFFTASQSCTHGALWALVLYPAFTAYDGGDVASKLEAAWGYDQTTDPDTWVWTEIPWQDIRASVAITVGAGPESTKPQPASLRFALNNASHNYTPDNPVSLYYPNVVPGTPIRATVNYGFTAPTQRMVAFVESWEPDPDVNRKAVDVVAYGRSYELQQNGAPTDSPLSRRLTRPSPSTGTAPLAHWSMQDGANATEFGCSMPGIAPLEINGTINLAAASDLPASLPLPVMTTNGFVSGAIKPGKTGTYGFATTSDRWCWLLVVKTPDAEPGATSTMLFTGCTGTARYWALDIVPGAPATFNIRAYAADMTLLLDDPVAVDEATFFGSWLMLVLGVAEVGANVSYTGAYYFAGSGVANTGSLASQSIGKPTTIRIPNLDGMAAGHATVYDASTYDISNDPALTAFTVLDGNSNEDPETRFGRVATEENLPFQVISHSWGTPDPSINLGPQTAAPLGTVLQETADTDQGQLHDGIDGDVVLVPRYAKYNADVTLTLDEGQGQVSRQFAPKRDTSGRVTDSTVSRSGGSSARYVKPGAKSPRAEPVTLSLHSDAHLANIAAHRVSKGTVEKLRVPRLRIDLRASPELTQQWLDCRIGSRVQALSIPGIPDPVDVFIDGWTEFIDADQWWADLNCSPAEPYVVGVVEDAELGRADTDGSALVSAVDSDDTALVVATTVAARPPWITTAAHAAMFPMDLRIGGERVTVTASASLITDPYTRSGSDAWTGGGFTYSLQGTAADYDVGGTTATIQPTALNSDRSAKATTGSADNDLAIDWQVNTLPASGTLSIGLIGRQLDDSNRYHIQAVVTSTGAVSLRLVQRIAGSGTLVATVDQTLVIAAATWYRMRVHFADDSAFGKLWLRANTEPDVWHFGSTGTVQTIAGANLAGPFVRNETAVTTHVVSFDNFEVLSPQTLTVTRSVNGVVKSHSAGAALSLWTPMRAAL